MKTTCTRSAAIDGGAHRDRGCDARRAKTMRRVALIALATIVLVPVTSRIRAQAGEVQLDPSFGTAGIVTTDVAGDTDSVEAVAIQTDGRIVAAGSARTGDRSYFALARYDPQGNADTNFGDRGNGTVLTDFEGNGSFGRAVALLPDGKILVAGMRTVPSDLVFVTDVAVARYNTDGTLDSDFGSGGTTTTNVTPVEGPGSEAEGNAVVVQPDGRIVVVGTTEDLSDRTPDFLLVRYLANGTPDSSFGAGQPDTGVVSTDFNNGHDYAYAVLLQSDGRILVAGTTRPVDSTDNALALARYNPDGSLDSTFGIDGDGRVIANLSDRNDVARAVALQADGSILVAGSIGSSADGTADFLLARFDSAGALDSTFGTAGGGFVRTDFGAADLASALVIQPDARIVVAGRAAIAGTDRFALARYSAEGVPDATFGDDGRLTTDVGPGGDSAHAVALQPDGRIVAGGVRGNAAADEPADFALARYMTEVVPPPPPPPPPPPVPHTVRLYLHGTDVPGTAGGYTMNATPAPAHALALDLLQAPRWFSEPALTGTFGSGATFQLVRPCTLGLGVLVHYRLAKTDIDGGSEQWLGQTSRTLGVCLGTERIPIVVAGPVTLANERLRLTISSTVGLHVDLQVGPAAFVEATNFTGTP